MSEIVPSPVPAVSLKNIEPKNSLALITNLLNAIHLAQINYCHWKSNEHLDASMTGDTDLDMLFDEKQKKSVVQLLQTLGFKQFNSIRQKQYKDIEDFIGLDYPSGKIIHLHTHFRLTMGEPYLKGYQLNLEDQILSGRVFDATFGIYRISPAFEWIMLCFREALKIRNRDVVAMHLKNKVYYNGKIMREYHWLKQRSTVPEVEAILKSLFVNHQPYLQLVTGAFNRKQLHRLSVLLKKEFKSQRLYTPLQALVLRWYRELSITFLRKTARHISSPIVSQRINPRGGLVIAIIGADGSGKSTVIAHLHSTFRKKLDVYRIYMGKGKANAASWPRKLLLLFKKKPAAKSVKKPFVTTGTGERENNQVVKTNLFRCIEALMVAYEKSRKLKQISAAKKKGMLVICDRYPQNQLVGYNDGPVLHHLLQSPNPVYRAIAQMEERVCTYAAQNPPDVVFKLVADAKTIADRKPSGATFEMLEQKIEGIKNLMFAEKCHVVTIDATQPLEKVLCNIKKEIWEAYP